MMKTIILLIGLYLIAPLSIIGNPSRWKKTIPAFDLLNSQLDNGYGQDKKECMRLITRMYVIANRHKDLPILRARALYWDARMNTNPDSAFSLLQKATALIDAKQHEYDIHRIQQLRTKFLLDKGEWLSAYIQAKRKISISWKPGIYCC